MANTARTLQTALKLHQAGQFPQAEEAYRKVLRNDPLNADALHLLGVLFHQTGKNEAAVEYIGRAISRNPSHALFHNNLGAAYQALGRLPEAHASLTRALCLKPDYVDAHNNLGAVLHGLGRLPESQSHYIAALRLRPDLAAAHNNLGNVVKDQGHAAEALACYQRALQLNPQFAEALNNIGSVLQEQGRLSEAEDFYHRAQRVRPEYAAAWNNLGNVYRDQGKWSESVSCFERALALEPHDGLRIKAALVTPVIVESADAISQHRDQIASNLARLLNQTLSVADPVFEVGLTSLYLTYHGRDDRELQSGMAALYARATPSLTSTASHCTQGRLTAVQGPIRIGFISRHFHNHSNARLNVGLVRTLSRQDFRVVLLRFPGHDDAYGSFVEQSADEVVTLAVHLETARRQIAELQLDVLFYTDIGMEPLTYFLAFARLAPVQCTTWGVPATTGIPAIDYFISSVDLEPAAAGRHYTERLVRLENLPTFYYPPQTTPAKSRAELGLNEHASLYVCPQSLFKIHPEFDGLIGNILRADRRGEVLLLAGQQPYWTELLSQRLMSAMPDVADRVKFLPRQSAENFLHILRTADVLLDPIHFGGGNTTYEAFEFGTPIVTWPGEFMRGRVTYACYRKLGVMDCVAADRDEYVRIAVRLANDRPWRDQIRDRILAAKHVLFENAAAVRELEYFLKCAVQESRALRKCA